MKKNGTATKKVAGKGSVLVVKAETAKNKKFDAAQAQTVEPQPVEEKEVEKPQEPQPVETTPEPQPTEEPQPQQVAPIVKEEKRTPTMQELKDSVTTLYLLQEKHSQLLNKRASLNKFSIIHERENAEITVVDANGEEFVSRSPKTIARLIEFWKDEFDEAIAEVENQLKTIFLGAA